MKIVVISGTGLIGTKLVRAPQKQGYEVVAVAVNEQCLLLGAHPRLGPTRFTDWLSFLAMGAAHGVS